MAMVDIAAEEVRVERVEGVHRDPAPGPKREAKANKLSQTLRQEKRLQELWRNLTGLLGEMFKPLQVL